MAQTVSKYTESLPAPVSPAKQHRTKAVPLILATVTIAGIGYLFWSLGFV
ncbi:hypothetical protein [Nostoc sp. FACHB-888]|nr:hypothetical protein [Nostoc sp. FACHB-888]MBD2244231.1 hypothetical protein [Nostoc sp. FACHB-888]